MADSEIESSLEDQELLATEQEEEDGYKERESWQKVEKLANENQELQGKMQHYQDQLSKLTAEKEALANTNTELQEEVWRLRKEENQKLQREILQLQEVLKEYESGSLFQRLIAEKEECAALNCDLKEEVRRLQETEARQQAILEEVCSERDQLKRDKETMSNQLMEKTSTIKELKISQQTLMTLVELIRNTAKVLDQEVPVLKKSVDTLAVKLAKTTRQLECKEREMSTLKEELAQVTRDYHVLRTENRQLCHRMQRRRWLDRRLRKHFQRRNPPAVKQAASIVRSQHERFQSLVRRRRAAMLMESLCFAFFVAKQQDAARARILYGTAVSDDDNGRCEVVEGGANPEGVAVPEDVVVEEEEGGRVCCRSELVVPTDVCRVLRHYLPVDVQRVASERQAERLQSPLPSINLVCPSSVDHSSCWLGRPQHQGKCRQRMRVFRSINRRCSRCGQPLKKSLRPNQPHSTGCGRGVSGGGWPPAMAIFRGQVRRYMRGVV